MPSSEARQGLIDYSISELERFKKGAIYRLSSAPVLGARFGISEYAVRRALRSGGLANDRAEAKANKVRRYGSAKGQAVHDFIAEDAERVRRGETETPLLLKDIAERFQLSINSLRAYTEISGAGLIRRELKDELRTINLEPSAETAWMLGVLAGKGHAWRAVRLIVNEEDILTKFKLIGERVFQSNSTSGTSRRIKDGKELLNQYVSFNNAYAARAIGNMNMRAWYVTLREKHIWIRENPRYTWGFLEGFFETKGYIGHRYIPGKASDHWLGFNVASLESAIYLQTLLTDVGLKEPRLRSHQRTKDNIKGVEVRNFEDIKTFAKNVHSVVAEKEHMLDFYLNKEKQKGGRPKYYTDEEIIAEWSKMREILGHPPTCTDIRELTKKGSARFSFATYAYRFGGSEGSFVTARNILEKIPE